MMYHTTLLCVLAALLPRTVSAQLITYATQQQMTFLSARQLSHVYTFPIQGSSGVALAQGSGCLYAINKYELQAYDLARYAIKATAAIGDSEVGYGLTYGDGEVFVATEQAVYVLDASTLMHSRQFGITSPGGTNSGVALAYGNRTLYIVNNDGLRAINPYTGSIINSVPFPTSEVGYGLAYGDGELYAAHAGGIVVLNADTLIQTRKFGITSPGGAQAGVALAFGDGLLYVINMDGLKSTCPLAGATIDTFPSGGSEIGYGLAYVPQCNSVADLNGDGELTPTDFTAWINAFNNSLPGCDQYRDGACTPTDFTAWIANFNAGC